MKICAYAMAVAVIMAILALASLAAYYVNGDPMGIVAGVMAWLTSCVSAYLAGMHMR